MSVGTLNTNALDGLQLKALRETILDAFDPNEFARLLSDHLNKRFHNFVPVAPFEDQVFDLLNAFRGRGWLDGLIKAMESERPDNSRVGGLRVTLGLLKPRLPSQASANASSTVSQLERLLRDASPYLDFGRWVADLMALQGRVCRIEARFYGTGLLVAPDLVLTNHHVVETEIKEKALAKEVICRFDYSSTGAAGVREGREVRLADDWLVADARYAPSDFKTGERAPLPEELDYSLLRLAEPAGDDTMGTKNRGVAVLRRDASQSAEKSVVQIVQHPKGSPLAMSIGTVEGYDADRLRIRYAANTEGGSSGAPVLAPDLSVVALHHAGGPDWGDGKGYNQGIPIGLIVRHAEATAGVPRFWS